MELWIRSQDKKKLCVAKFFELDNDETGIFCFNGESYSIFAGKYKSKERALEVLDEIQNILKPKYILDSSSIKPNGDSWVENGIVMQNYNANARIEELSIYVYEMPED